jgi:hypothetical protein
MKTHKISNDLIEALKVIESFLETFHNDPDWQEEFWDWMENKKYGKSYYDGYYDIGQDKGMFICKLNSVPLHAIPKQMLTGYIHEFIQEYIKE